MSLRVATRRLLAPSLSARAATTTTTSLLLLPRAAAVQPLRSTPIPSLGITRALRLDPLRSFSSTREVRSNAKPTQSNTKDSEADTDGDAPPPKASFRDRLKFLTKRYGWWALGVYLAASAVDFSLTFLAIHLLGADHIRSLETSLRKSIGLEKRTEDASNPSDSAGKPEGNSTIWTEAVLAYTIHKTLLLPFRVMITAAVTPSFVKWLVKMGWARQNYMVKADVGKRAADKAIQEVVKRNIANAAAKETAKHH